MRSIRLSTLAVALAIVLAGCGNGEDRPGMVTKEGGSGSGSGTHAGSASGTGPAFPQGEASAVVDVAMEDYRFVGIPPSVKGPKVFFKLTNRGSVDHELQVIDANGRRVGHIHHVGPRKSGELAVELAPGTYTLRCLVETGGKTHVQLGMESKLTVE